MFAGQFAVCSVQCLDTTVMIAGGLRIPTEEAGHCRIWICWNYHEGGGGAGADPHALDRVGAAFSDTFWLCCPFRWDALLVQFELEPISMISIATEDIQQILVKTIVSFCCGGRVNSGW